MLFNRSSLAIMEEDFGPLQKALELLLAHLSEEAEAAEDPLSLLRTYLDEHPETVFDLISRVKIINVNLSALKLYNFSSQEEMEGSLDKIMDHGALSFLKGEILAQAAGETFFEGETVNINRQGEKLDLLISIAFPDNPGRGKPGVVSILDITHRKAREKEQEAKQFLSETLREITMEITGEIHRDALLDKILAQLQRMINFTSGNIKMFFPDKTLRLVRSIGYEEWGALEFVKNHVIEPERYPVIQQIMKSGDALIIEDTHAYPGWTIFPETSFIKSVIFLPLVEGPDMIGEISLESDRTGAFRPEDAEKLRPFAAAASLALKNATLYEKLAEGNRKQELLLRELHHRVKNNLALVNSLINLQFDRYDDPKIKILLQEVQSKIFSILLVHQKLYDGKSLEHIPLDEYLRDLLEELERSSLRDVRMDLRLAFSADIYCEPETLIPLGLITTELFTNTVKHARPDAGTPLQFTLESNEIPGKLLLIFSDNGQKSPAVGEMGGGIGLTLINSLTEQIDGSYRVEHGSSGGYRSILEIPASSCT